MLTRLAASRRFGSVARELSEAHFSATSIALSRSLDVAREHARRSSRYADELFGEERSIDTATILAERACLAARFHVDVDASVVAGELALADRGLAFLRDAGAHSARISAATNERAGFHA